MKLVALYFSHQYNPKSMTVSAFHPSTAWQSLWDPKTGKMRWEEQDRTYVFASGVARCKMTSREHPMWKAVIPEVPNPYEAVDPEKMGGI
jgi:predicted NUDIX family NTP pyrophosphohydrolase